MAAVRHTVIVVLLSCAVIAAQPAVVPSPIPASRLLQTSRIDGPLEVRPATADEEAIIAGTSYVKSTYEAPSNITVVTFITTYRDALFTAGWKLIAAPKVDNVPPPEGIANIAAHYMANSRNVYTRLSRLPEGQYEINVADVGEEDWSALLTKQCHVPIYSLHFDLDRPALKLFESEPTLQ